MPLQVQLMIVYVALLQLVEDFQVYPLNHDDIRQFMEVYHYLMNLDNLNESYGTSMIS